MFRIRTAVSQRTRNFELPARLPDTGNQAIAGHVPETNAANAELAINRPATAAQFAAHPNADLFPRQHLHLVWVFAMRFELNHLLTESGFFGVR
jgi:hypothetical protein